MLSFERSERDKMKTIGFLFLLLALHTIGLDGLFWAINAADESLRRAYANVDPSLRPPTLEEEYAAQPPRRPRDISRKPRAER